VANVGSLKRAVQKASTLRYIPWLATEAHGNKQTNKQKQTTLKMYQKKKPPMPLKP
jgi:hypothetical protein